MRNLFNATEIRWIPALVLMTLCWMLLFLPLGDASGEHWEFAGWYGGGCYPNVAFDPQNKDRVYLTSDVAGIWRSDDLGEHWNFINKGLGSLIVAQVAIAPSDSNVLYAATNGGVFVSHNAGELWTAIDNLKYKIVFSRPWNYRPIAIDAKNPDKICVGTAQGNVYCTKNAGHQWTDIDPDRHFFPDKKPIAALSFDGPDRLMVATPNGLSHCLLNGNTCEAINNGPTKVTDFIFSKKFSKNLYVAGDDKLWISKDAGLTWGQSEAIAKGTIYRIALDESGDKPVIHVIFNVDWNGGIFLTRDEGKTWESRNKNLNADKVSDPTEYWARLGGKANSIQVDPFDPNVVFRTDWWEVFRSDDGGASWNEKIKGAPNTVASEVLVTSKGELYVASMDNGLLRSLDNGKTYEPLFPKSGYNDEIQGHVWRVAINKEGGIVGTSSPWSKNFNQVILSYDGGKSFDLIRSGLPTSGIWGNTVWDKGYAKALAIDPQNRDTLYLGIDGDNGGGLFISNDGGAHWDRSIGQPGSLRVFHGLAVDPTDSNRIVWGATGSRGGVYISNDKGQTFQYVLNEMSWVFNVAIGPDGTIYAGGDKGGPTVYVSNADKQSFRLLKHFDDKVGNAIDGMAVNPKDPKMIAVSTVSWSNRAPCKFYLSHDAGRSWDVINGDLPDGAGASSMTFDPQGQYLYIARYAGSVYKIKI
jgi:photosystem II stability/assembly factor-like uncharacterized protein